jgi:hypothetical protein
MVQFSYWENWVFNNKLLLNRLESINWVNTNIASPSSANFLTNIQNYVKALILSISLTTKYYQYSSHELKQIIHYLKYLESTYFNYLNNLQSSVSIKRFLKNIIETLSTFISDLGTAEHDLTFNNKIITFSENENLNTTVQNLQNEISNFKENYIIFVFTQQLQQSQQSQNIFQQTFSTGCPTKRYNVELISSKYLNLVKNDSDFSLKKSTIITLLSRDKSLWDVPFYTKLPLKNCLFLKIKHRTEIIYGLIDEDIFQNKKKYMIFGKINKRHFGDCLLLS